MNRMVVFKIVLRVLSVLLMLAIFGAMLPTEVMVYLHKQMGLGEMPEGVIVDYLARTLSLFYAFNGAILYYLSIKPEAYWKFLKFYLWLSYPFAIGVLITDICVGMPVYWTAFESPFALVLITFLLLQVRQIEKQLKVTR